MKNLHAKVCIFKRAESEQIERGIVVGSDSHDRIVIVAGNGEVVSGYVYFCTPLPHEGCIVTEVGDGYEYHE